MKHNLYQRLILSTNSIYLFATLVSALLFVTNCATKSDPEKHNSIIKFKITPTPVKLLYKRGYFQLDKSTRILMNLSDKKSKEAGEYLLVKLKSKTHYKLKIADRFTTFKVKSSIEIITNQLSNAKQEGFKIEIKSNKIKIYAFDRKGLLYAVNTVLSLLTKTNNSLWQAPQLLVEDYPATTFRGIFIPANSLKISKFQLLDLLQKNRINHLITPDTTGFSNTNYIVLLNAASLNFDNNINKNISIKDFYNTDQAPNDTLIFSIKNADQLHPDSIALIGEAMWSKSGKRNYNRIKN